MVPVSIVFIVCITIVIVSAIRFAKWQIKYEEESDPEKRAVRIAEKRRVLERDRAEWAHAFDKGTQTSSDQKALATNKIYLIDQKLLELADE